MEKPKIRFKGYQEDWEQRKLGEVCSEIGDGLHSAPEYDDNGNFYFINGNNLINGHIVINSKETKRVSEKTFEKNNKQLDDNTVLLSINGTIGNLAYYQGEPVMLGKSAAYLKANKIDKTFLYSLLQTTAVMNNFMLSLTGTTIKNLGLDAIKNTKISIPELHEQKKIGLYFSQLDNLITLHQRKCEEMKTLKKYMLQKMFPQNGQLVPQIRFSGFTEDWEQRKVSEYANFFTGNGLNWNDISDDGEQECILYGNLYTDYGMITENIVYRTNTEIKNPVYSEYGDVLIPASDTTPTGLARATSLEKSGVLLGGDINIIRPNEGINGSCLSLALNANRKELIRLIKGTTVRHIHNSEIKDIAICLPKLETEQVRISSYFKQLDHLITLHQQKCDELRNIKKFMLQNMFI